MYSTQNNFFKINKTKQNNVYTSEGIKTLNFDNLQRGKTSCSPIRNTGLCDIFKKAKIGNSNKLPVMNSYNNNNINNNNNNPYKFMNNVNKIVLF